MIEAAADKSTRGAKAPSGKGKPPKGCGGAEGAGAVPGTQDKILRTVAPKARRAVVTGKENSPGHDRYHDPVFSFAGPSAAKGTDSRRPERSEGSKKGVHS